MKQKIIGFSVFVAVGLGLATWLYPKWHQNQLNTALQSAVTAGNVAQATQLLTQGADVNTLIIQGVTPLTGAVKRGQEDIVHTLIEHGADVRYRGVAGVTPLYLATEYGYPTIMKMLLDKGADPNVKNDQGHTVLDVAQSVRRIRSKSSHPLRPPTVATIDEEIQLLQRVGAKAGDKKG